jgi:hypothetical protein
MNMTVNTIENTMSHTRKSTSQQSPLRTARTLPKQAIGNLEYGYVEAMPGIANE